MFRRFKGLVRLLKTAFSTCKTAVATLVSDQQKDRGDFHCQTEAGANKETNEDAVLCAEYAGGYTALAVADGMGGHDAGDIASQIAIESLETTLVGKRLSDGSTDRNELLKLGFQRAHREIVDFAADKDFGRKPGTTLVATLIGPDDAVIANVGDSRAYRYDGQIQQLTTDQTQVQELIEAGELDPQDADEHPYSHVLAQALGTAEDLDVEFCTVPIESDLLLLCSDGLTDSLSESEISRTLAEVETVEEAGARLIDLTFEAGAPDDVSVALFDTSG